MSKRVKRNKPLTINKLNFYCMLREKAKSKRLRKKVKYILERDKDIEILMYGGEYDGYYNLEPYFLWRIK